MKKKSRRKSQDWQLYVMLLPAMIGMIVFHYMPMYGVSLAFKRVQLGQSIFEGTWVGLENFRRLFQSDLFGTIFKNTITITFIQNFLLFPLPIIFALLIHNAGSKKLAKFTQSVTYLPHLLSTVVIVCIIDLFCSWETGLINLLLQKLGMDSVYFMGESQYFLPIYIISSVWSGLGADAVIYIAALSSVDQELIEASIVDGANKLRRIWHIELPTIRPTIILLLIMKMGNMLSLGYEQILLMQNNLNLEVTEVLGTYVYKTGILSAQYGFSTAVSLFQNVVGLILVIISNKLAKKYADIALF